MATIFRGPSVSAIPKPRAAIVDAVVNNLALRAPNPSQPFRQQDWPLAARPKDPRRPDEPPNMRVLLSPNPARPFHADDWPAAARARLSLHQEDTANRLAGLQPNPTQPFTATDWPLATRGRLQPAADIQNLVPPASAAVAAPFAVTDWPLPARRLNQTIPDAQNLLGTLLAPTTPFHADDWPLAARPKPPSPDHPTDLAPTLFAPVAPFTQNDWPLATRARAYLAWFDQFQLPPDQIPPAPPPPPAPSSTFDPLLTHGGQGRRRWDHDVRRLVKGRPDDEVLDAHLVGLVAHLLGVEEATPAARRVAKVLRDSASTIDAIETAQWELAEAQAIAAILETKVAGLERVKARLRKQQEDEQDDEDALNIILSHL